MKFVSTLLCALVLGVAAPAWADVTRDQAAAAAAHYTGGRVLAVERGVDRDNRPVWRVKVVTSSGDLKVILVDPATGRAY
jgi:hypothetical protein